ncbi:DMT family transporter [Halorussus halophilus]|uniref:DMT family transporter n=1 Tax=Halorussus halophilus TaxID=2650975 RepID=UPI001301485A|nr:EamA family transporter [Halorussus halophilus]
MFDSTSLEQAVPTVSDHTRAVFEAVLVTILWSSSYVFIKIGLTDIPALPFAGLRYGLAALVLFPIFVHRGHHRSVARASHRQLVTLLALGLVLYAVTQGAQFVALNHLQAATVSLALTFTPVVVGVGGFVALAESPTTRQWVGVTVLLIGAFAYFRPETGSVGDSFGLTVMTLGLLSNAVGSVLGRRINHGSELSPLAVTTVSMGVGAVVLLVTGLSVQGVPSLELDEWAIVCWLALVNTAGAFTLWNRSLQTLTAVESSVVGNTMLVQVALLGWFFLGESLYPHELVGIAVVSVGVLVVQLDGN